MARCFDPVGHYRRMSPMTGMCRWHIIHGHAVDRVEAEFDVNKVLQFLNPAGRTLGIRVTAVCDTFLKWF